MDRAGRFDGCQNCRFGNFVENDSLGLVDRQAENLCEVPGDRLSFAVFIGREPDGLGLLGQRRKFLDNLAFVARNFIDRFVVLVQIDAEIFFREVPDMPEARLDDEILAQEFFDGLGFGRGLDYY